MPAILRQNKNPNHPPSLDPALALDLFGNRIEYEFKSKVKVGMEKLKQGRQSMPKGSTSIESDWSLIRGASDLPECCQQNPKDHCPLMKKSKRRLDFMSSPDAKIPRLGVEDSESDVSLLESLPMYLLVEVICHLHHDQLQPISRVSKYLREALLLAWKFHFDYTTPNRSRLEMLHYCKGDDKSLCTPIPHPPNATRQRFRPPLNFLRCARFLLYFSHNQNSWL